MLDLHTHILPKMDDGSKSSRQSIRMLRRETKQGVTHVVLTPHFYPHREAPERFLKRRAASMQALREKMDERTELPEVILGAEVAYFTGIGRFEGIESLCIGDTQAVLIEMPFSRWNSSMIEELVVLRESRGIQPIIAHIERYMRYQPHGTVDQLHEAGIWIQANAEFFQRWQTSWIAMRMLKRHRIQFIGSDCHATGTRPPNYGAAIARIEKRLGKHAIEYLKRMERRLLEGRE